MRWRPEQRRQRRRRERHRRRADCRRASSPSGPPGIAKPDISNLNFLPNQTVPNLVTVALGTGGQLSVYNNARCQPRDLRRRRLLRRRDRRRREVGSTASTPLRDFDTRDGTGGGARGAQLGPDGVLPFKVTGKNGVPATGVTARRDERDRRRATPRTASSPSIPTDVVVRPIASNLNFVAGQTVPNLVVVRVPSSGFVDFYNKRGFTHVLADVVGYYDDDLDHRRRPVRADHTGATHRHPLLEPLPVAGQGRRRLLALHAAPRHGNAAQHGDRVDRRATSRSPSRRPTDSSRSTHPTPRCRSCRISTSSPARPCRTS